MTRFWYRLNLFAARYTAPVPMFHGEPLAELPPTQLAVPVDTDTQPTLGGFHPFRTTLVSVGPDGATAVAAFADRAWWDQRGENNPWPIDPPDRLDLAELNLISRRDW